MTTAPYRAAASAGYGRRGRGMRCVRAVRRADAARNLAMPSIAARNTIGMTVAL